MVSSGNMRRYVEHYLEVFQRIELPSLNEYQLKIRLK